mmetsp:Transcript_133858/g.299214  ORF Transcript_133858/g.299214 Transcript_133858/m.299214 type:complete len:208 (-) Transcript_133858:481-1104(-)
MSHDGTPSLEASEAPPLAESVTVPSLERLAASSWAPLGESVSAPSRPSPWPDAPTRWPRERCTADAKLDAAARGPPRPPPCHWSHCSGTPGHWSARGRRSNHGEASADARIHPASAASLLPWRRAATAPASAMALPACPRRRGVAAEKYVHPRLTCQPPLSRWQRPPRLPVPVPMPSECGGRRAPLLWAPLLLAPPLLPSPLLSSPP